jgi:cobalamin-dependent methionine synthase I
VRKDLWGYAADEQLSNEALITESYAVFVRHRVIRLARNIP